MSLNKEIRPSIMTHDPGIGTVEGDYRPTIRTGPPSGSDISKGQAQFKPDLFDSAIAKHGWDMWWSKALLCPCKNNDQTEQADPLCIRCHGKGWLYVLPDRELQDDGTDNAGNLVELNDAENAVAIQGIVASMTTDPQVYERMGQWVFGSCRITTYRHNRLGYGDRLTLRNQTIALSQLLDANGEREIPVLGKQSLMGLWAPLDSVDYLSSNDRDFVPGSDFSITDGGALRWEIDPPERELRLSLTGHFLPRLVVMDHVFVARAAKVLGATGQENERLPSRANAKLEFMAEV